MLFHYISSVYQMGPKELLGWYRKSSKIEVPIQAELSLDFHLYENFPTHASYA